MCTVVGWVVALCSCVCLCASVGNLSSLAGIVREGRERDGERVRDRKRSREGNGGREGEREKERDS